MKKILKDAKAIISKKYEENDPNYGLLVLGCYSLLSKFGENYKPIVEKVMLETDFHISNSSLKDMLIGTDVDLEMGFSEEELDEDDLVVTAVSMPGYRIDLSDTGSILLKHSKPAIYCSTKCSINNTILNAFVHEASHLVKSTVNCVSQNKVDGFLLRSGLNIFGYYLADGELRCRSDNSMFDEVINVLQTADMMQKISELSEVELDGPEANFFRGLNLEELDNMYGYGYTELSNLVRELWNVSEFKNSIEDNIVIGKLNKTRDDFDSILGKGTFHLYSTYLDYIDGNYTDSKLMEQMSDWYRRMNRLYIIKSIAKHKK